MAGQDSFEFIGCEKEMRKNNNYESSSSDEESDDERAHIVQSLVHEHGQSCTGHVDLPVKRLVKGFKNFIHTQYRKNPEKFDFLAQTQKPKFLVFSCSDSRVSPSHILDFQLGEAFMAQNIAALIPSFNKLRYSDVGTIIEYAVHELKVENILVIGHSKCGGITRLMAEDKSVPFDFIDDWVNIALPAKIKVQAQHGDLSPDKQIEQCVQESVNLSLENLQTYPYVEKAIEEGKLALRGGFYDFVAGSLKLWEFKDSIHSSPILI